MWQLDIWQIEHVELLLPLGAKMSLEPQKQKIWHKAYASGGEPQAVAGDINVKAVSAIFLILFWLIFTETTQASASKSFQAGKISWQFDSCGPTR